MSALDDLLSELQTNGLGTVGTDLFINVEPSNVAQGIMLRQTGGMYDPYLGCNARGLEFQAVIRDPEYPDGLSKAETVMETLNLDQVTIGGSFFFWVRPMHEPIPFGREASGTETFVLNFEARWRQP